MIKIEKFRCNFQASWKDAALISFLFTKERLSDLECLGLKYYIKQWYWHSKVYFFFLWEGLEHLMVLRAFHISLLSSLVNCLGCQVLNPYQPCARQAPYLFTIASAVSKYILKYISKVKAVHYNKQSFRTWIFI